MRLRAVIQAVGYLLFFVRVLMASDGTRLWSRMWGSSEIDLPHAVAIDTGGFVYVAGGTRGSFDGETNAHPGWKDIFLTKFSPDGMKCWSRMWGTNATDEAYAAAGDLFGNIFVAGDASGNFDGQTSYLGYTDFFLSTCASDGTRLWSRVWDRVITIMALVRALMGMGMRTLWVIPKARSQGRPTTMDHTT